MPPFSRRGYSWWEARGALLTVWTLCSLISPTLESRLHRTIDPNAYHSARVELYNGSSVAEFLSLCTGGSTACPLAPLYGPYPELHEVQYASLRRTQRRVQQMLDNYDSYLLNTIRIGGCAVIYALAFYLVMIKKHIDFKLFGREWVFDASYGFHAKILRRMKFVLKPITSEEYIAATAKKKEAARKLREDFERHEAMLELESDESETTDTSDDPQTKEFEKAIIKSSRKQRIVRKKLQQKFEDAKQQFILDERKSYKDEDLLILAEIQRLENESKSSGYHRKLLSKFKEINDETDKRLRQQRIDELRREAAEAREQAGSQNASGNATPGGTPRFTPRMTPGATPKLTPGTTPKRTPLGTPRVRSKRVSMAPQQLSSTAIPPVPQQPWIKRHETHLVPAKSGTSQASKGPTLAQTRSKSMSLKERRISTNMTINRKKSKVFAKEKEKDKDEEEFTAIGLTLSDIVLK